MLPCEFYEISKFDNHGQKSNFKKIEAFGAHCIVGKNCDKKAKTKDFTPPPTESVQLEKVHFV